jgi:hypothetical protein
LPTKAIFAECGVYSMLTRHKKWLLALFQQVNELRSDPLNKRLLALEIQEELLRRIGLAERLIRRIRSENRLTKKTLAQRNTQRDVARNAKVRHLAGEQRIAQQRILISILRSIGDSIAFIYGDRWDLKQMVLKEESGFITGKRGTRLERKILRKSFEVGATVVMNDLTHTLRHGDITVFRPDLWPEGGSPLLLIEAKSGRGGGNARKYRQLAAAKQVFDYLTADTREADGGIWQRVSVKEHPQYHFEEVTRMMMTLPHADWLMEEVEPGLHYVLINCSRETREYGSIFGDLFSRIHPFMISMNDMKEQTLAYYPFPLCIHNPDALFRFYNGEFVMFVIVDLEHVNKLLIPHSISVTLSGSDEYPWMVSSTGTGAAPELSTYCIGFHPVGRLAAEFLRLDWLLENVVAGLAVDAMTKYLNSGM